MKKIVKTILAVACFSGIILAGCENPDGSCNLLWSLTFIGIAGFSGLGYKALEDEQ